MKNQRSMHSMMEFYPIIFPVLKSTQVKTVCAIGVNHLESVQLLGEWLQQEKAKLITVDAHPVNAYEAWLPQMQNSVQHFGIEFKEALAQLDKVDAWIINGDPNWYTVYHQLAAIRELSRQQNRMALIFVHHVGWPWGLRDCYLKPDQIPTDYRQAYTAEKGLQLDQPSAIEGGLYQQAYSFAINEHGEKNGVLTAINNFSKDFTGEYCFAHVPGFNGLGVLFDFAHPHANLIATMIIPFQDNMFLQSLETDRLTQQQLAEKKTPPHAIESETVNHAPAVEGRSVENAPSPLMTLEQFTLNLLNQLEDDKSQSDVWSKLAATDKVTLQQVADYLELLLAIPQDDKTIKLMHTLQTVCFSLLGDQEEVMQKVKMLKQEYPQCDFVAQTISYIEQSEKTIA